MARSTLNAHLSLLATNELLAYVKTQTQPHFPPILDGRLRNLMKTFPDLLLLLLRESWPLINHQNPYSFSLQSDADPHRL
jgi:hypothetical protein